MKSGAKILIFLSIFLSCAMADELTLHTSDAQSLLIANHIYPKVEKKEGSVRSGWYLKAKSEKKFSLNGEKFTVYSWNEINNPGVSTQMDHYNYGGLLILKNDSFFLRSKAPNQVIKKIIIKGNSANIVALYSFAQRGSAEEYINVYKLNPAEKRLKNVFSRQTLESNLMGSGDYHMQSDIIYRDLNGDGVQDILIKEKLYEVIESRKTNVFKIKEVVKFIVK